VSDRCGEEANPEIQGGDVNARAQDFASRPTAAIGPLLPDERLLAVDEEHEFARIWTHECE
jgi:hypothetical protein